MEVLFSAIRGVGFGVGLYRVVGIEFGKRVRRSHYRWPVFGYSLGISPSMDYVASRRPRLHVVNFGERSSEPLAILRRHSSACSGPSRELVFCDPSPDSWTGIVTGVGQTINPTSKYYADSLRSVGSVLSALDSSFAGSLCNRLQYWFFTI